MWVFTPEGFYSAIEWRRNDEHQGQICVRTRSRGDLNRLRKWIPGLTETIVTPNGDYRYRAWCSHVEWADGLAAMGEAIDYSNFKTEVGRFDRGRERKYHRIWSILGEIQKDGPYGWYRKRSRRLRGSAPTDDSPSLFDGGDWGYPFDEPDTADDVSDLLAASFSVPSKHTSQGHPVRGHFRGSTWIRPYVRGKA
jgi:hypothetical protein